MSQPTDLRPTPALLARVPRPAPPRNSRYAEVARLRSAIPAGRYGVEYEGRVHLILVDKPTKGKWASYVFIKERTTAGEFQVRSVDANLTLLTPILADLERARQLYTDEAAAQVWALAYPADLS